MTALLAVAHGSKDDGAQGVVEELLSMAAAQRPGLRTAAAYIDNASPSIAAAIAELVAAGEGDVAVVPLLLTPASHSKTDVAASVQAARVEHPQVRVRYGRPLGPHPFLVDVVAQRLTEAGARAGDAVVLAAGGSLDPDANAQVAATARLLWEGRDYASVDVAFASTTRPTVEDAIGRLMALGVGRIAVASYFLGPGRLPRAVESIARGLHADVVIGAPVGAAPQVAALLLERYDEALGGDIRMNCDACLYRIPLPGRKSSVGAPQVAHTHPDDTGAASGA